MAKGKELKVYVKTPILVLVIYLLLALTGGGSFLRAENTTDILISTIVLQILVFVLPTLFYCRLTHLSFVRKLNLKWFRPGRLILLLALLGTMICGSMLINLLCYLLAGQAGQFSDSSAYALAFQVSGLSPLYVLLTFCLVPAVCEEFVFRGVVLSEYAGHSAASGMIFSALFFGMSHFHFLELPAYFFCGVILVASVYMTKSLYAAILLHFANNVFSIYVAPYIWTVVLEPQGPLFAGFFITAVFLISLALVFREAEAVYYEYAYDPVFAGPPVALSENGAFYRSITSPTLIFCVLVFGIVTLAM